MRKHDSQTLDRRRFLKFTGAGALAPLIAGCSGDGDDTTNGTTEDQQTDSQNTDQQGQSDATLTAALSGATELVSLDPPNADQSATWALVYAMMEGLVGFDNEMNLQPELATDWDYTNDTTIRFQLREDVQFHNGDEFTAEDVKFSLERVANGDFTQSGLWTPLDRVEIQDDYTVDVHTTDPYSPILTYLAGNSPGGAQILPSGAVGENFSNEPIGTGPFQLESWETQESVTLNRFDEYWGETAQLESVELPIIGEGSTAVSAIQAGDIHMMNRLPLQSVDTIQQASDVTLGQAPGLTFRMVLFNHDTEPFDDRDVRMAFAKSVDKNVALQAAWFDQGDPSKGPIPVAHSMYSSDLEDHQAFDPDEAASLIDQSGYSVSEINEMGLEVLTWGSDLWYQFSQVVADQVSQNLGIEVGVNSKTFGSTFSDMENQSFDLVSWGYRGFTAADQYMFSYVSDSSRNAYRGYSNEEYDNLVLEARAEMDPDSRREIYLEAQNVLGQDAADINLVHADMLEAYRNSVQNYSTSPQTDYAHDFNQVTLND